tara:strand:- start:1396 stop:1578 length:183 start_codon:yes stop_codon:yes gene_type:complete
MMSFEKRKETKKTMIVEIDINGLCPDPKWIEDYLSKAFLIINQNSPLYINGMRIRIEGDQ